MVTNGDDGDIIVWNLKIGIYIKTLEGHKDSVFSICITSDNQYIISGSLDNTIRIWNF